MNNDEDLEQPNATHHFERREVILSALCGLTAFCVVAHYSSVGRGRAAGVCAAVDFFVVKHHWKSRGKVWYWCAILLIVAIQVLTIMCLSFGDEWIPTYGLLPAALLAYVINVCVVSIVGKVFGGESKSDPSNKPGFPKPRF